jgi:nucleoside-diphosphate-sugar epimerase
MGSTGKTSRHVLITGAGGFIGQALASALMQQPDISKITLTDITKPDVPTNPSENETSTLFESFAADLTAKETCQTIIGPDVDQVYLLHGIMSGAAEANYDLGLRVNIDSMRYIFDTIRGQHRSQPCRIVFPSSLAVFGPSGEHETVSETTIPAPQSSYGAEKAMVELLLNDLSRRGFVDGRIVRLPTIIVRPGKPTGAASSFCSGIIREPLSGQRSELPVKQDLKLWVCSARTIIDNLVAAMQISEQIFQQGSRILNLPGQTVTVAEMLQALKTVGGSKARQLVDEVYNENVAKIVGSWPAVFDDSKARKLGFRGDVDLDSTIQAYIEDYM